MYSLNYGGLSCDDIIARTRRQLPLAPSGPTTPGFQHEIEIPVPTSHIEGANEILHGEPGKLRYYFATWIWRWGSWQIDQIGKR